MSPNSLNEPATPIVAPNLPSLASLLTSRSLFVQTVPTPIPATIERAMSELPCVKGAAMTLKADRTSPSRWLVP